MNNDRSEAGLLNAGEPQWVKVRPEWVQHELARRSCLDMLMSRFGLHAALVSVPQLGKVLGMSKSTIYASVKAGKFFIPSRLIGSSSVFTIDDVVNWYLTGHAGPLQRTVSKLGEVGAERKRERQDGSDQAQESSKADEKHRRDREVDNLVARALKSMAS